jgi:hypothetical protein
VSPRECLSYMVYGRDITLGTRYISAYTNILVYVCVCVRVWMGGGGWGVGWRQWERATLGRQLKGPLAIGARLSCTNP